MGETSTTPSRGRHQPTGPVTAAPPRPPDYPELDGSQGCAGVTATLQRAFDGISNPRPAITLCRTCPVAQACRAFALEHEASGVWGGTTEDDRRRWRRAHHRPEPRSITIDVDAYIAASRHHELVAAM